MFIEHYGYSINLHSFSSLFEGLETEVLSGELSTIPKIWTFCKLAAL